MQNHVYVDETRVLYYTAYNLLHKIIKLSVWVYIHYRHIHRLWCLWSNGNSVMTCICNYFYKICNLFRLVNAVNELMKLENLIDYSACHCRIGKPKLIFHDPFCISFLPVRHAVAQRNLVFSFEQISYN